MDVEFLIVGHGLSGGFLSYALKKANRSFLVIDEERPFSASRVASGIINPVTGRRIVKTWMIEALLPFAKEAYREAGSTFGINCIEEKNILDFFPTLQMQAAFQKRFEEGGEYLKMPVPGDNWRLLINHAFGYGEIDPCYLIDVSLLLAAMRKALMSENLLVEECFEYRSLELNKQKIKYKEIHADKIIFCDGTGSHENPYFKHLPFAPNKGELLIAEIPGLPRNFIIKYGMMIVPWKDDLFWIGASNEWKFQDEQPTVAFRERTTAQLQRMLKMPFKIMDHLAALRPATLERRPFLGFHPLHPQVGIFNGMGTKGCSLAPYFARHLVSHLLQDEPLLPEVDISRFRSILTRS